MLKTVRERGLRQQILGKMGWALNVLTPVFQNRKRVTGISLRYILSVPFVLQVTGVVGGGFYIWQTNVHKQADQKVELLIQDIDHQLEHRFSDYFSISTNMARATEGLLAMGLLDNTDPKNMGKYLWAQMQGRDVLAVHYGDRAGQYVGVRTEEETSEILTIDSRPINSGAINSGAIAQRYGVRANPSGTALVPISTPNRFTSHEGGQGESNSRVGHSFVIENPTRSSWFTETLTQDQLSPQSLPFIRLVTSWPGTPRHDAMRFSVPVRAENRTAVGVLGVDVSRDSFREVLRDLAVAPTEALFIMTQAGEVVAGFEKSSRADGESQQSLPSGATQGSHDLIPAAIADLQQHFPSLTQIRATRRFHLSQPSGDTHQVWVKPCSGDLARDWLVVMVVPDSKPLALFREGLSPLVGLGGIAIALSGVTTWLIARWVLEPIHRLNGTARAIARCQWPVTVNLQRQDELGDLAQSFNQMGSRLRDVLETLEARVEERTLALHQSQCQLNSFFAAAPIGMCLLDRDLHFLRVNQHLATINRMPLESFEGRSLREMFPKMAELLESFCHQVLSTGEPLLEQEIQWAGNEDSEVPRTWLVSFFPVPSLGITPVEVGAVAIEVSDRKLAEAALHRSQEQLRLLEKVVESATDGFVIIDNQDPNYPFIYVNPAFERITGYSAQEVLGQSRCFLKGPDDNNPAHQALVEAMARGESCHAVIQNYRKDGSLFWRDLTMYPLQDGNGVITHYVGVQSDITAQKQVEAELREAIETAEAAARAKSIFLANMSHELRSPLNAILGFTEVLALTPLTPNQQQHLQVIHRSGKNLLELINDILDISKIEAGRITLNATQFDLHSVLDDLDLMFRGAAQEKGLQFFVERGQNLPTYIWSDRLKLRQILVNLLANAIKFTYEGEVRLAVRLEAQQRQGGKNGRRETQTLTFIVTDTGIGIAPDELEEVFKPFVQTRSGKQSQQGTGLGLSISRCYAQLLGGNLRVASEPGQSTTFTLTIPAVSTQDSCPVRPSPTLPVTALATELPTYRILVAGDDPTHREPLIRWLTPCGLDVREAVNGEEAIALWDQWHPHLVWLEPQAFDSGPHTPLRHIKSSARGQGTPVIALVADELTDDKATLLTDGWTDVVYHPLQRSDVFQMLFRHLGIQFMPSSDQNPGRSPSSNRSSQTNPVLPPLSGLAQMPRNWRVEMEEALLDLDEEAINALMDQVQSHDEALALTLRTYIEGFAYNTVLEAVRSQDS